MSCVHVKLCHLQTDNITTSFSNQVLFLSLAFWLGFLLLCWIRMEKRDSLISFHTERSFIFISPTVILHSLMINLTSISKDKPWDLKLFCLLYIVCCQPSQLYFFISFIEFFSSKMFDSFMDSVSLLNFSFVSWNAFLLHWIICISLYLFCLLEFFLKNF